MSPDIELLEAVLANTRQQLSQVMAVNAELSALLQHAQERLTALETDTDSGDTKEVKP